MQPIYNFFRISKEGQSWQVHVVRRTLSGGIPLVSWLQGSCEWLQLWFRLRLIERNLRLLETISWPVGEMDKSYIILSWIKFYEAGPFILQPVEVWARYYNITGAMAFGLHSAFQFFDIEFRINGKLLQQRIKSNNHRQQMLVVPIMIVNYACTASIKLAHFFFFLSLSVCLSLSFFPYKFIKSVNIL